MRGGNETASAAGRRGFIFARACFPCTDFFLGIFIVLPVSTRGVSRNQDISESPVKALEVIERETEWARCGANVGSQQVIVLIVEVVAVGSCCGQEVATLQVAPAVSATCLVNLILSLMNPSPFCVIVSGERNLNGLCVGAKHAGMNSLLDNPVDVSCLG